MDKFEIEPVGYIHCGFKEMRKVPLNGRDDMDGGTIEILPKFETCILGIKEKTCLYVFSYLHKADRSIQLVHPHHMMDKPARGVFSTCSPVRPNPIGMTYMEVEKVEGRTLYVKGIDLLDGTPVIDIKLFDPSNDLP